MYFVKKNDAEKKSNFLEDFNSFFNGGLFTKDLKTDIEETDKEYLVTIDVPGLDKKDINLSYEDSMLMIDVTQKKESEDKNKSYIRKERSVCSMSRSYYLENGDENSIKAKLENGTLHITIQKLDVKPVDKKCICIE